MNGELNIPAILAAHAEWIATGGKSGKRANLHAANLYGADLSGADLRDINLSRAYLSRADLSRAYLYGADMTHIIAIIAAGYPEGWCAYGWLRDDVLSIRVGCREKRLPEARAYWSGKDDRREVLAAVEYIAAVAAARGWKLEE